jgi:hypothetical protein
MQEPQVRTVTSPTSELSNDETGLSPELFIQQTDALITEMQALYTSFKDARQKAMTTMYSLYNKPNRWLVFQEKEPWKQLGAFKPFVQKLPIQPGETVYILGDIHANVIALLAALKELQRTGVLTNDLVVQKGNHLVFLGDYTDRGTQGVETWYTLLQLRAANPEPSSLILLRGNHEDADLNRTFSDMNENGYFADLQKKLGLENYSGETAYDNIYIYLTTQLYNYLPVALYVVCERETALCVHGGLEVGFDPKPLITATDPEKIYMPLGGLKRNTLSIKLPVGLQFDLKKVLLLVDSTPKKCLNLNFLWNDFNDQFFSEKNERGDNCISMGNALTQALLKRDNIACVFRGHQHNLAFEAPRNQFGFHTSSTGLIHTIMSFNRLGRDNPVCSAYSFVKLIPGKTFAEWKAWHMRDEQEYPIDLTIKEPSREKSLPEEILNLNKDAQTLSKNNAALDKSSSSLDEQTENPRPHTTGPAPSKRYQEDNSQK